MRTAATRARDHEDSSELMRICLGITGALAFVAGCVGIGIAGLDRQTLIPLVAIGLALYAASLARSR